MKIINGFNLTFIFGFVSLFAVSDVDYISVNKNIHTDMPVERPDLVLRPTNPMYTKIECELATLKRHSGQHAVAKLDLNNAPELHKLIMSMLSKLCACSGIEVPPVQIYFDDANDSYNAQANMQSFDVAKYIETKRNNVVVKRKLVQTNKVKKNCLQLGEGLIKLLLWNVDGNDALESIIAHEVGHMAQDENMNKVQAEYDADARAVKLVGKSKADLLIQSINKTVLAGHIFNILAGQADIFRLSIDDVHQLNRIITNSIARYYPTLGDLSQSTSHAKFGLVVNKVFMDALKYSFDSKKGLTEENFYRIYEKLEKACKNMQDFMGGKDGWVSMECAYVEQYSNQYFSPATHPTPENRFKHIQNCVNCIV